VKALITGSSGFIGSHFFNELWLRYDPDFTTIDLPGRDCRDFFAKDDSKYDLVIHAAAHVGGRADIDGRPTYLGAYNAQLDGAMFEWALRTRPRHVVYFSSSAVYPARLQTPEIGGCLYEDDVDLLKPEAPESTYGWHKLYGEMLANEANKEGLSVHVFRPFSGYGEDQDLAYPFPSFIERAKNRMDPFEIWGHGTQVRDWIHISDIVNAVLRAVDENILGPVNLCSGVGIDFNTLAYLVTNQAGYEPQFAHLTQAPRGVSYRVGSSSMMEEFYEPKITLEEGIRRALDR
jgi:nucleoside-diphosphate-sugar epimerase